MTQELHKIQIHQFTTSFLNWEAFSDDFDEVFLHLTEKTIRLQFRQKVQDIVHVENHHVNQTQQIQEAKQWRSTKL